MKIIFNNKTELKEHVAFGACMELIEADYYPPLSLFSYGDEKYAIFTKANKSSITMNVSKYS